MFMLYAIAAPLWLLTCAVGMILLAFGRTRKLAAYVIAIPTFAYWMPLLAAGAILLIFQPIVDGRFEQPSWLFAAIFSGSQLLAGLVGVILGVVLAFRLNSVRQRQAQIQP